MTMTSIGYGIAVGIGYSLKGWFNKSNKSSEREFDVKKFAKTVIVCAIVGGVASQFGMTIEAAMTSLEGMTILTALDIGVMASVNTVWKKISSF